MTQKNMYTQVVGKEGTTLLRAYVAGTDTSIDTFEAGKTPDAPNAITITSLDGSKLVTVEYTSKSGATLSGLRVVEGNTPAALTATYPAGSAVTRPLCKMDVDAIQDNIRDLDARATANVNKLEGVQLAGTDLAISGKKVNIPLGTKTQAGVFKAGLGLEVTNGTLNLENPLMQTMHGIKVDWGNSNPATNIKYSLLSTLRTPASPGVAGDWDASWLFDDDQRYYVVLHNIASATAAGDVSLAGTEHYRLDPNNIFKKKNGETAILDGTDGDVMVCRKLMWDKYLKGTGTEDEIILSKGRPEGDPGWYARAFEYKGTIRDRVYYGVCHAYKDANNRLRSIIDYTNNIKPTANTTITNFETYATNNGEGYSQWNVNLHDMMQMLFWFKYRNMNSQAVLGYGYCGTAETDPRPDICGGSFRAYTEADPYSFGGNPSGYDYGLTTGNNAAGITHQKTHCRFEGADDLWGNVVQWCKGVTVKNLTVDGVTQYWVERAGGNAESPNFNNWDASKVRRVPTAGITANKDGYISGVSRLQEAPLQPVNLTGGASNKYVCDSGYLYSGCVAHSGGH